MNLTKELLDEAILKFPNKVFWQNCSQESIEDSLHIGLISGVSYSIKTPHQLIENFIGFKARDEDSIDYEKENIKTIAPFSFNPHAPIGRCNFSGTQTLYASSHPFVSIAEANQTIIEPFIKTFYLSTWKVNREDLWLSSLGIILGPWVNKYKLKFPDISNIAVLEEMQQFHNTKFVERFSNEDSNWLYKYSAFLADKELSKNDVLLYPTIVQKITNFQNEFNLAINASVLKNNKIIPYEIYKIKVHFENSNYKIYIIEVGKTNNNIVTWADCKKEDWDKFQTFLPSKSPFTFGKKK